MNCACNRYITCTECRNAYKEMVKQEKKIVKVVAELDEIVTILEDEIPEMNSVLSILKAQAQIKAYRVAIFLLREC